MIKAAHPWVRWREWWFAAIFSLAVVQTGVAATATPNAAAASDARSLEALLTVLEDDEQRARFLDDLRSQVAANSARAPSDSTGAVDLADGQTGLNTDLAAIAGHHSERLRGFLGRVGAALVAVDDLPTWFHRQVSNSERRAFWIIILIDGLLFPLLVTVLIRWGVGLSLGNLTERLNRDLSENLGGRVLTGIARLILEVAKVAAVLAAGYVLLAIMDLGSEPYGVAETIVLTITLLSAVRAFGRLVFVPRVDAVRPLPIVAATAAYLHVWFVRLATVAVGGFALTRMAAPLGANADAIYVIRVLFALVFTGMLLMLVMQSKRQFAAVIRGTGGRVLRRRLADIWHVLAIVYIVLVCGVFVSGAEDGFLYLLRGTAITAIAVAAGLLASYFADRIFDRIFALDPDLDARFPGLRARSTLYRPFVKRIFDAIIAIVALMIALGGWNIGVLGILSSGLWIAILKSAGTIALVLVLCILAWELSASAIARVLAEGRGEDPGSRAKTLLPLMRRAILLTLVIVGGLIILSEIGVDTAPLLAGAGVLGLAVGFGSQALVRDIITGLFILIEDTIAVGDVVTVGGHTGVVEDLSIRTIRLRDLAGTVHTVPFGNVTTVENLTKDYSFALLDIGVGYREDTDAVCRVLGEIFTEIRADEAFGPHILDDIEILGVNELADSAVVIRARIRTRPVMQWSIRREFLRLAKKRFDELGIEIPFPHTTVYFGVDKDGRAPPAHIIVTTPARVTGEQQ